MAIYTIDNRPGDIDFECNRDLLQRTIQNCKNLLMTRMGEIPYDRKRGVNPAVYDLPLSRVNDLLLPEIDRVFGWEPDAKALSAVATRDAEGNTIITVEVEIKI